MTLSIAAKSMIQFGFSSLGFVSQALLFLTFAIMSLFAAPIVARLHPRYVFVLTATLRVIWEASFILPSLRYHRIQAGEKAADITSWFL